MAGNITRFQESLREFITYQWRLKEQKGISRDRSYSRWVSTLQARRAHPDGSHIWPPCYLQTKIQGEEQHQSRCKCRLASRFNLRLSRKIRIFARRRKPSLQQAHRETSLAPTLHEGVCQCLRQDRALSDTYRAWVINVWYGQVHELWNSEPIDSHCRLKVVGEKSGANEQIREEKALVAPQATYFEIKCIFLRLRHWRRSPVDKEKRIWFCGWAGLWKVHQISRHVEQH